MPYIKIEENTIHYTDNRVKSEPVLVAVHGSGGDYRHWPETLRRITTARVICVDMPGHGRSAGVGCRSVNEYATFLSAFIDRLELTGVCLAGHSLGGAILLSLALDNPEWLERIVLVGTGARLRVTTEIIDGLTQDFDNATRLICETAFGPDASAGDMASLRSGFMNTEPLTIINDFLACDRFDVMERIHRIETQTLIISGSADELTPVKYGNYLAEQIPGAIHRIIENAGHMMALEKPEEFVEIVIEFLESHAKTE